MEEAKSIYPEKIDEFEKFRIRIGNSQKVIHNIQKGLLDPYLFARKGDFEKNIRKTVASNIDLNEKYGHIWDSIAGLRAELKPIEAKLAAYRQSRFFGAAYFRIADKVIEYAELKKLAMENPNDPMPKSVSAPPSLQAMRHVFCSRS